MLALRNPFSAKPMDFSLFDFFRFQLRPAFWQKLSRLRRRRGAVEQQVLREVARDRSQSWPGPKELRQRTASGAPARRLPPTNFFGGGFPCENRLRRKAPLFRAP